MTLHVLPPDAVAASQITCESIRADELRDGLMREMLSAMAITIQVQGALHDCDDERAVVCLFALQRGLREDVRPLLKELVAINKQREAAS